MSDWDLVGKTIGQYQIVESIGAGGMATIFKAYQAAIDRYVAIKIIPPYFAEDVTFVKRFLQEAKAIASLEHPHILAVYDFGTYNDLPYLVMRYVDGGTLDDLMPQSLADARVVEIIGGIADALAYAHRQGVVHRDIKPSNILFDVHGQALLADFGVAKKLVDTGGTQLTSADSIMGTPNYMAPEQASGLPVDGRSDIYALGVVLYELLTGRPPYQGATPLATVLMHVSEPLPPPRSINPHISSALEQVVLKAMEKDPDQRYQTAAEMAQALRQALHSREEAAAEKAVPLPPALPPAEAKPVWTNRFVQGGVALTVVLLIIIGVIGLAGRGGETDLAETGVTAPLTAATDNTPPPPTNTPAAPLEPPTSLLDELLAGSILFREQFGSNERGWFINAFEDETGRYEAKIVNGRYRLSREAKESLFMWQELPEVEFDDFVLVVEAFPISEGAPFAYGLTFRSNANSEFYTFEVNNIGAFKVRFRGIEGWQVLVEETPMPAIVPDAPNRLIVKASGPALSFYVNGQLATTLEDAHSQSGRIGVLLEVEEGQQGAVEFDDLTVREINEAE